MMRFVFQIFEMFGLKFWFLVGGSAAGQLFESTTTIDDFVIKESK
jgi:hypothetical protein